MNGRKIPVWAFWDHNRTPRFKLFNYERFDEKTGKYIFSARAPSAPFYVAYTLAEVQLGIQLRSFMPFLIMGGGEDKPSRVPPGVIA